jgi:cytochrome c oxidase assembly protein subunit 15
MRERLAISPGAYRRVAHVALFALTAIVLTGAAVRLTGSGLGCPDWPKCYGKAIAPLETHAVIEYGNRILSGLVGFAAIAAFLGAWLRRPFRRDLFWLSALLPLGVVAQAILGGFTVRHHLAPGFVMAHFGLAMLVLIAAVALAWRAREEPRDRAPVADRASVWAVRALAPLGALTIFAGTAATAAGPHAGGKGTGDRINRLEFKGAGTLDWAISQHARLAFAMGLAVVGVWVLLWRRRAAPEARRPVTVLAALLGAQGAIGTLQYLLELPAEMVWFHVSLAAVTWVALLWAVAAVGAPAPRRAPERPDRLVVETASR